MTSPDFLNWHLNKKGISDEVIADFLQMCQVSKKFKGVYPFTNLPKSLKNESHFSIIVNIGHHFVTLHVKPSYILYIDSFGQPISDSEILIFLGKKLTRTPLYYNTRQIQSLYSSHCGIYAIFFILYHDKRIKSPMKFKNHDLLQNDDLCIHHIKSIVHSHL